MPVSSPEAPKCLDPCTMWLCSRHNLSPCGHECCVHVCWALSPTWLGCVGVWGGGGGFPHLGHTTSPAHSHLAGEGGDFVRPHQSREECSLPPF